MRILSVIAVLTAFSNLFAQGDSAPQGGSFIAQVLPMIIVMFVIIYFFMIRPEQKKQKKRQGMMDNLKKGDKILTIGGIYAKVNNVKKDRIVLKISENTDIEVSRTAVSTVLNNNNTADEKK